MAPAYTRFEAPFTLKGNQLGRRDFRSGVDSSVQKNTDYSQNSDKIYGRKKCLIFAFFYQHYGRNFCRNLDQITVKNKVQNSIFFHRVFTAVIFHYGRKYSDRKYSDCNGEKYKNGPQESDSSFF
jgi:hypothetical protein